MNLLESLPVIERPLARSLRQQQQEGAGDGDIFHKQDELHLLAEITVKYNRRDQREDGQQGSQDTRLESDQDRDATGDFECDYGWQQDTGNAG